MTNPQFPTNSTVIQNADTITLNGDFTKLLYQVGTLTIGEDGTYGLADIGAVNIFGGLYPSVGPQIKIDTTTLANGQAIVFVNTGGKLATLTLSNGGTIGGQKVYTLQPGNVLLQFDGTNLIATNE
jgi:hypothetical protein